jgi:hypothetical protein
MSTFSRLRLHSAASSVEITSRHEHPLDEDRDYDSEADRYPLSSRVPLASLPPKSMRASNLPVQRKYGNRATHTKSSQRSFLRSWFFEIIAVMISILSFQAAIGVMIWANNKPLANWHFQFSVNTIVSILTIVSRTTLAFAMSACLGQQKWNLVSGRPQKLAIFEHFDAASRGPLGGLRLFISLRLK